MDVVIALAYLAGMITVLVCVGRRTARFVRQVPAATLAAPDARVLRRRFVRVIFGLALLAGLAKMIAGAPTPGFSREVLWIWPRALVAAVVAALVAPFVVRLAHGDEWEASSIVVPTVAVALVLPITLHALVFALSQGSWTSFDSWCGASAVGAAVAHVVFAVLFSARALSLARSGRSPVSVSELFMLTTIASAFPFFIFGMGITAVTGIAVLPVIYLVDRLAVREHAAISIGLPRAIVAPCRA